MGVGDGERQGRAHDLRACLYETESHRLLGHGGGLNRVVDVGAQAEQRANRIGPPSPHREHQRGEPPVGTDVDIRALLDQEPQRQRVVLGGRPHHRRLAAPRFYRVDVGALRDERAKHVHVPRTCGRHQHRLAVRRARVRLSPRPQQRLHDGRGPPCACQRECGYTRSDSRPRPQRPRESAAASSLGHPDTPPSGGLSYHRPPTRSRRSLAAPGCAPEPGHRPGPLRADVHRRWPPIGPRQGRPRRSQATVCLREDALVASFEPFSGSPITTP